MNIRTESSEDFDAIRQVNIAAFGRTNEADLVDELRKTAPVLSFVAVEDEQVVGHILFSPVSVEGDCTPSCKLLGLAPIGVIPEFQNQGVGTQLVQHSLPECSRLGFSAVVVLGHPEYYPRFGFVPASRKGLTCEYEVPDEAFMVVELQPEALQACSGRVKYRPEFAKV
ncbi:GNAT family N-acetyltransferase [Leptolyngbya sp. FACHB-261]|uniref:GNAT family N-acetyltransferase n=1 Tax=Leptolyngbya sp. FACHB-261 TaxID=2692806 RepID=UPI0016888FAC|nr:N-acetyltransferase [Leptolyngbya sp. FACHB-261]MBD2102340.1 N-acetyltransferase [Leptolyngbya sp. FACHB-261]